MIALIAILSAVALVALAYAFRDQLDALLPALKGWRTVILNGASAGLILAVEMVGYLAGFSWGQVLSAQAALWITLALNLANIALRFATNTPVGDKGPM